MSLVGCHESQRSSKRETRCSQCSDSSFAFGRMNIRFCDSCETMCLCVCPVCAVNVVLENGCTCPCCCQPFSVTAMCCANKFFSNFYCSYANQVLHKAKIKNLIHMAFFYAEDTEGKNSHESDKGAAPTKNNGSGKTNDNEQNADERGETNGTAKRVEYKAKDV